ncbi:DUF305 domain-containing protein [Flavobacterium sp.]|uniref:DUF305 domain-containing protein n=1 Tax=Flavobacterium sp. TaxID=239 RepID=UPI002CC4DDDD|nr:DUF305 domain-containing protein [Flavobacterium sp.]HSD07753.1 DUF305 domain-containing protein [Flavobacterium sp.]
MKIRDFLFSLTVLVGLYSCNNNDNEQNGLVLQSHDENQMMDSLHAMSSRMDAMVPTKDPEIDFLKMMAMHHKGAINMAKVELESGKNEALKEIANKMTTDQQQEIKKINDILQTLSIDNSDPVFTTEQKNNMLKMDKNADAQPLTGDTDNDFATLMILHHQSATDNASAYLHHGNNDEIKEMATMMITMQTQEIIELSDWLKNNRR